MQRWRDGDWTDAPYLFLGYLFVVFIGLVVMVLVVILGQPVALKAVVPALYLLSLTFGTRTFGWPGFASAVVLIGIGLALVVRDVRVQSKTIPTPTPVVAVVPASCPGWTRPLNATELAIYHKQSGTVADAFTETQGGNEAAAYTHWQSEGGKC